jgi:hypothetical protein
MGTSWITALSLAAILVVGMAFALTQFCLVRGVLGLRTGNLSPARCVVGLSLLIALSLLVLAQWRGGETMPTYNPRLVVLFGGLVFGLAARANGGCFVGTLNGLCQGESRRLFTIAGWILGYALLRGSPIPAQHQTPLQVGLVLGGLGVLLLVLNRRARHQHQRFMPNPSEPALQGAVAWALMLTTGILVGLLHHSNLPWDPSNLAKALGESLRGSPLTAVSAYALPIPLGMALVHGLRRDFSPVPIKAKDFKLLPVGMLMAMGSVWSMGANDSFLFRYLPLGSMHAALGLTAMAVGILLPDWLGTISTLRRPRTPTPQ